MVAASGRDAAGAGSLAAIPGCLIGIVDCCKSQSLVCVSVRVRVFELVVSALAFAFGGSC